LVIFSFILLIAGINFSVDDFLDVGLLVAHSLSFVSGMIVCVVYHRWFTSQASEDNLLDIIH
jgi:hypothetical protein